MPTGRRIFPSHSQNVFLFLLLQFPLKEYVCEIPPAASHSSSLLKWHWTLIPPKHVSQLTPSLAARTEVAFPPSGRNFPPSASPAVSPAGLYSAARPFAGCWSPQDGARPTHKWWCSGGCCRGQRQWRWPRRAGGPPRPLPAGTGSSTWRRQRPGHTAAGAPRAPAPACNGRAHRIRTERFCIQDTS